MLKELVADRTNYIAVACGESSELMCLCIQFGSQRELFTKFPEVLQFDGTYRINKWKLPLYTLLATDNNGKGCPICFLFVAEETICCIKRGLQLFASVCVGNVNT